MRRVTAANASSRTGEYLNRRSGITALQTSTGTRKAKVGRAPRCRGQIPNASSKRAMPQQSSARAPVGCEKTRFGLPHRGRLCCFCGNMIDVEESFCWYDRQWSRMPRVDETEG